ncbi:hypothetical protein MNB_SUP05-SYMBIONT-7-10 [hydrothermal vent metagenome]|uniref:Uncharacterized protein n=1 Tax=hydrothermal vent metagenome TaxID=652676 RepID=A0A1W1E4T6_9ZZZZ
MIGFLHGLESFVKYVALLVPKNRQKRQGNNRENQQYIDAIKGFI